jgi:hypothetical protein
MRVVRTVPALRRAVIPWRKQGQRVALVPTMGALHAGHLALAYYSYPDGDCTASTCQLEADLVTSDDGGSNWTSPQQLTPASISLLWLPSTTQGTMAGDYISTSFSGSTAFPVYADAQAPSGGLFQEAAYTAPVLVTTPQRPTRSGAGVRPVATSAYFPTGRRTSN